MVLVGRINNPHSVGSPRNIKVECFNFDGKVSVSIVRCKALKTPYFGKIAQFCANELATLQLLEVLSKIQ